MLAIHRSGLSLEEALDCGKFALFGRSEMPEMKWLVFF